MSQFKVTARAEAHQIADAVWEAYYERERAARGLPPGASLDMRNGQPVNPPITTRYADPIEDDEGADAALPVDEFMESLQGRSIQTSRHGRVTIDVSGHVDTDALPEKLRDRVRGPAGRVDPPGRGR